MKRHLFLLGLLVMSAAVSAQTKTARLSVDASKQIATASRLFDGTNIEDINNQTNGGVFSQLLHGAKEFVSIRFQLMKCMEVWVQKAILLKRRLWIHEVLTVLRKRAPTCL